MKQSGRGAGRVTRGREEGGGVVGKDAGGGGDAVVVVAAGGEAPFSRPGRRAGQKDVYECRDGLKRHRCFRCPICTAKT